MKKFNLFLFFLITACCLLPIQSFSQFAWKPFVENNGWQTSINGGPVRAMNVSQTHVNPTEYGFYFGGEFNTISNDSASVHYGGAASPFYMKSLQCYFMPDPSPNGVQHPSVWAIASSFDITVGHWFACAGKFSYEEYIWGYDQQEDYPQNIAFWMSGGQFANNEYLFPALYIGMDTVFAIAIAPSHSCSISTATVGDFKTYVAARCVFCDGTAHNDNRDSSNYIGYYSQFCGNPAYNFMQGGTNGPVYSIVAIDSAKAIAGGRFDSAGVIKAHNIAIWKGTSWDSLGSGVNGVVKAMLIYNNKLYVGGNFTMAGGNAANNIAVCVWDGSNWNWSALGTGTNGTVYALTIHNGDLYAGGAFTQAGGNPANYIAHWNDTLWSDVGGGRNNEVYALASFKGDLYAGGNFSGGVSDTLRYIARYTDTTLTEVSQISIFNSQISIYPNPTNGKIEVRSEKLEIRSIEIYNALGEKVYSSIINSQLSIINLDVSDLPSGVYIVKVKTEKGVAVKKFVKE